MPNIGEYYPIIISAVVAFVISWFSSRWTVRLSTHSLAFSKLQEIRIREYPELYSILSDLLKALETRSPVDLEQIISRVNEWDSKHAIFMERNTSNVCFDFRKALHSASTKTPTATPPNLHKAAVDLELALRSDLGIHGFNWRLLPKRPGHY